jgi:hypothetical protein
MNENLGMMSAGQGRADSQGWKIRAKDKIKFDPWSILLCLVSNLVMCKSWSRGVGSYAGLAIYLFFHYGFDKYY